MTAITPQLIKSLRERTGIGMAKCKQALEAANGDIEQAIADLRKAGMASAVKKEGREAKEGTIGIATQGPRIALVEVNSETDFVVKNDSFQKFVNDLATLAVKTQPKNLEAFLAQASEQESGITVDEWRLTKIQEIGENIQIRRLAIFEGSDALSVGVYSHMGGKIATVVEITGSGDQQKLAEQVAMHVAAASPEYTTSEEVPADVIAHEKDIARAQMKGKPESMIEKILEGKMNAFYTQVCLDAQPFIKDDKMTVGELVAKEGKELKLKSFIRWQVGQD